MNELELRVVDGGVRVRVWVKPRASKNAIVGVREGALEVAVAAPPVDGEANAELTAFLAKFVGLPKRAVSVVSGETGRAKIVRFDGLSVEALQSALGGV